MQGGYFNQIYMPISTATDAQWSILLFWFLQGQGRGSRLIKLDKQLHAFLKKIVCKQNMPVAHGMLCA